MMMSIGQASEYLGVTVQTLRRWEKIGKLKSIRTEGNHRRYNSNQLLPFKNKKEHIKETIGYCRVSSSDQKSDLERQIRTVSDYCAAKGYQFRIIRDLGSGLNYQKKGLNELIGLICSGDVERIVINYKDRLIRYGYEMIEKLCEINSVTIEVINHMEDKEYEQELVEDVLSIITVFSSKLYGSRSHKAKQIQLQSKELFEQE